MNALNVSLMAIGLAVSAAARGAVVIAVPNQETQIAVNAELGSILQLPSPVKTITPSQYFSIQDVGAATEGGSKTDVRAFQVKPVLGAQSESVTFVLASGRALALRLMVTPGGEKFYDIQVDALTRRHGSKFLGAEMAMMRSMLVDEVGGFARELTDEKVDTEFPDLVFRLSRVYAATDLVGYVFKVKNTGRDALDLNLSALALGRPSRAALAQSDKLHLEACPLLGAPTDACQTAVRLVIRGPKPVRPVLGALGSGAPPFAKAGSPSTGEHK